nr:hypothetical protein GCM10010200_100320 [Actinomadura rugatobispora]
MAFVGDGPVVGEPEAEPDIVGGVGEDGRYFDKELLAEAVCDAAPAVELQPQWQGLGARP